MHVNSKAAAVTAAMAIMVPVGVAQANHPTGKAGAPGQACKNQQKLKKGQLDKAPRKVQQLAYKTCIKQAIAVRRAGRSAH